MGRQTGRQIDGWADRQTDRQTDRQMGRQTNGWEDRKGTSDVWIKLKKELTFSILHIYLCAFYMTPLSNTTIRNDQNQNQVLLAKYVCTNKEFVLVKWPSVCLHM